MKTVLLASLLLLAGPSLAHAVDSPAPEDARLLRFPDVHGDTVVFSHAGDLWTVPLSGGTARRLTTSEGLEIFPRFSPDGKWIAFTGQYDGSSDVYVIPAEGGEPRRLTWYPARDNNERMGWDNMVIGWTPEGKILFRSQRGPEGGFVGQPYTVSPNGGPVERFPLPESGIISFSPDGKRIAYTRNFRDFRTWKRYQGGQAPDVWIYDLAAKTAERITDWVGTDTQPMWVGNAIFFLSDRENWKLNLWRYDLGTKQTTRVTDFKEFDVKWAHSGSGKIVFENGGWIYVYDPATGAAAKRIQVALDDDQKLARKRWVKVEDKISDFAIAPGGSRAVFAARGDIFTVPAEHGNIRNLTKTQGVRERAAAWSPDGKWIAYISDAGGEEELWIVAQDGRSKPVQITSGSGSWHFPPVWSPDSKKLAWSDRAMTLNYVDISDKKPVRVDKVEIWEISQYAWSPDSKWIGYAKQVDTDLSAIFLYSLESKAITRVTYDWLGSYEPAFDPGGKYLYFLSDRDLNPQGGAFENSFTVNKMARPYAVTLRADLPSPFAPQSDEVGDEKKDDKKDDKKDESKKEEAKEAATAAAKDKKDFRIDLPGIEQRLVAFPVAPGNYDGLAAAPGKLTWLSLPVRGVDEEGPVSAPLHLYDLEKRKDLEILPAVDGYDLSPDGKKLIYKSAGAYYIAEPKEGMKPLDGKLDLSTMRMELDPKAEWAQIFHEVWRVERDYFYLPDMGKIDWPGIERRYKPLLAHVAHRGDLTYVLGEMVGELGSGHSYVGGGDAPHPERVPVGLLGADLVWDAAAKAWKITRIIPGQNWMESRRSPLTEPGIKVAEGDYLLAIDGSPVGDETEPYHLLAETVGRTVALTVNAKPTLAGSHEIQVSPVGSESDLRYYDWVETNRKKVDKATGGRVGYIHIPDMGGFGLKEFIRQYYPQVRKDGLVVDVRANGGGNVSQMILERLRRTMVGMDAARTARSSTYPSSAFHGPMVCLLNMYSASDGDIFPWYFKQYGLGPTIGTRSWGGVVGIRGQGGTMADGGYVFVPEFGIYNLKSQWVVENHGVDPDIVVDNLPGDEMAGRDAQLERAIQEVMKAVEAKKPVFPPRPPSPDLANPAPRQHEEVQ